MIIKYEIFVYKLKGLKCDVEFEYNIKDYALYGVITTVIIFYESFEIKPDTEWEELEEFINISKLYNESDPIMIIANESTSIM